MRYFILYRIFLRISMIINILFKSVARNCAKFPTLRCMVERRFRKGVGAAPRIIGICILKTGTNQKEMFL
uniref:Uncharacterized protein n=1 Tax=Myoviridae sp. ctr9D2 TaxID=2827711 RepID=A0A8S5SJ61_9CAUD|nr:MAG TPA: hypothetical protein [Myoviridae sp. ctr9D2]